MEGFMINLKTFLGLAMPNQSCLDVTKQILCWFFFDILGQEIPSLHDPYIQCHCIVWYSLLKLVLMGISKSMFFSFKDAFPGFYLWENLMFSSNVVSMQKPSTDWRIPEASSS